MTVTSGRQCAILSLHTGPLGSLVKMCLESSRWGSTLCVPIWKPLVTPSNRLLFRLALWEPTTDASASGLLPTLTVTGNSNAKGAGEKSADGLSTKLKRFLPTLTASDYGSNQSPTPGAAVRPNLRGHFLPMLTATDAEQAKCYARGNPMLGQAVKQLMPTLLAADAKGGQYKKPQGGPSLRTFLPTLCARDFMPPHKPEYIAAKKQGHGMSILPDLFNGPLNPRWCEWFMGYPIAHTELKALETRSSRKSRSPSSRSSVKSKEAK